MHHFTLVSALILASALSPRVSAEQAQGQKRNGKSFFHYQSSQSALEPVARYMNELPRNLPNSPIYYVRLPPMPYSFIPGFGYVSQPAATNTLVNLPINFLANGKPSNIYRWNGAYDPLAAELAQTPVEMADSTVHRLQGKFPFNGKVTDLYLYKDPYDTFMEDTLQTIYP